MMPATHYGRQLIGFLYFNLGEQMATLTVTINQAAGQADPASTGPILFDVVFSEPVVDFRIDALTIGGTANPTIATLVNTIDASHYQVALSGMLNSSGTMLATIGAGGVHDVDGAANLASTSTDNVVTFANVAPSVTINQAAGQADPASTGPILFDVVFSEPVVDFRIDALTIGGTANPTIATLVNTIDASHYQVALSGMLNSSGTVLATIGAGGVHDVDGAANLASTSTDNVVTMFLNNVSPTVSGSVLLSSILEDSSARPITQ